jgi:hypothetical protein
MKDGIQPANNAVLSTKVQNRSLVEIWVKFPFCHHTAEQSLCQGGALSLLVLGMVNLLKG